MPAALLGAVLDAAERRSAMYGAAYRKLVDQCARGETPDDPDAILKALSTWGRDVQEFQADVERKAERLEARAEFDQLAARRAVLASIVSRAATAQAAWDAEVKAAHEKLQATLKALADPERDAQAAIRRAEDAERKLVESAPPELQAAVTAARDAHNEARNRLKTAIDQREKNLELRQPWLRRAEQELKAALAAVSQAKLLVNPSSAAVASEIAERDYKKALKELDHCKSNIADLEKEDFAELRAEVARLDAELQAAQAAFLTP